MRVTHRFEIRTKYSICPQCLSPRMNQKSNNRYNPNDYGSLRITPIACGLEAPKRHGKKTRLFIHPQRSFSFNRNYKQ